MTMKVNFRGEFLPRRKSNYFVLTILSVLSIPISRIPLLEKSLITVIPLLVMDCDKPVGLLMKSKSMFFFFSLSLSPTSSFAVLA